MPAESLTSYLLRKLLPKARPPLRPAFQRPPITPVPSNVVSNAHNSPGRNGDGKSGPWRGQILASLTNGVVDACERPGRLRHVARRCAGTTTDFVGLVYPALYRFDRLTVELGLQFGDGGDWESTPRVFVLKNPVDTGTASPESDPELGRAGRPQRNDGSRFSSLVTPGPGGTVSFDLTSFAPALRTGYGLGHRRRGRQPKPQRRLQFHFGDGSIGRWHARA